MSASRSQIRTVQDWKGRSYDVEIAYVAFVGGHVIWVDDDLYNKGEPFPSRDAAMKELKGHMEGMPGLQ
jgi:hypothetical protein